VAAVASAAVFLVLTVPRMHWGPVNATGQDAWYNAVRALRSLYEHLNPSYFIHPALYYELLALLYALQGLWLWLSGRVAGSVGYLDYFLTHQAQFLDLARAFSVACGALAVAATVWLGALLSTVGGGLLAGIVVASLPLLQAQSAVVRVDAIALATSIGAGALLVKWYQAPSRRSLLVAGAAIGLATAANYPAALHLALMGWLVVGRRPQNASGDEAGRPGSLIEACAVALAAFLAINPYVVLDFHFFWRWFTFLTTVASLRHPHAPEPSIAYYLPVLREQGIPAMAACAAGVLAATTPWKPAGALALYAIVQLAAFSLMRTQYDRFVLPPIVFLCTVGAAWFYLQLGRIRPWAKRSVMLLATGLVAWAAAMGLERDLPGGENRGRDYRQEMFAWIAANVPASATLVIESDVMPLLQTIYDRDDRESPFRDRLRAAFENAHPHFVRNVIKSQFIGAVYNYDPKLLEPDGVFFLASSQNRDFIHHNRELLIEPAAFYAALDRRATVVHEQPAAFETLRLYCTGSGSEPRADGR
jgi:hypothetical protein